MDNELCEMLNLKEINIFLAVDMYDLSKVQNQILACIIINGSFIKIPRHALTINLIALLISDYQNQVNSNMSQFFEFITSIISHSSINNFTTYYNNY